MLVRALLQTSLVLWLAQQTLQGGVKPQSVSWGRVLPARGVGVGVKPGVAGALGALGSRYGSKAMKTGIGRYAGAQLGLGGYRALGFGGRAGLRQGGYGTQGAYGASLGTGMGLGAGLPNGLGLGHGGKRVYGAGLGTLPGYGALAGIGYPGARPGVLPGYPTGLGAKEQKPGASAAGLGGPVMASLGRPVQDLMREKSRALGHSHGNQDRALGPELTNMRRSSVLGPTAPNLDAERNVKSPDTVVQSSSLGPTTPLDKQSKILGLAGSQAQGGGSNEHALSKRKDTISHEATLTAGGVRRQLPADKDSIRSLGAASPQSARGYDSSFQRNQRGRNCDLSDVLEINRFDHLGSGTQRTQGLVPQPHVGKESRHLGHAAPQTQGEGTYRLPLSQAQDVRSNTYSTPQAQGPTHYLSAVAGREGVKGLVAEGTNGPKIHGTVTVESRGHGPANLQVQGGEHYGPVIPGASGTQSLGIASIEGGQEVQGFTEEGQGAKHLSQAEHDVKKSKALRIPGQAGRNTQATSYLGGAGNYLGPSLGAGGYGAGLGQGAYLGGAAGKLGAAAALGQGGYPQGAAGISTGYGEGLTGYLGAVAGNGFGADAGAKALSAGYGNGYGNGYGAGLGYPAELADGAENKAGKSEALSTGGYAGQVQGAYGGLGAGLESTGGKYAGGAAQVPYGNAPVLPAGLEGDGGYPYAAQQLSLNAEGAKTTNKYGAGVGYGAQQTGYGAQLGATQEAVGEPAGKYGGVNGALGNGYKG